MENKTDKVTPMIPIRGLSEEHLAVIDALVMAGVFRSRSALVKKVVEDRIKTLLAEEPDLVKMVEVVSQVYTLKEKITSSTSFMRFLR